jgi:hypothetical protein
MTKKISDKKIKELRKVYLEGNSLERTAKICNVYILTVFKYVKDISRPAGFQKGIIPWNKGKKYSEKIRKKMSINYSYHVSGGALKKGHIGWNKGKKLNKEQRKGFERYWSSLRLKVREKHPMWKGNRELKKLIRDGYIYQQWRDAVFLRDNFTCQDCGKKGYLEAHHNVSFSKIMNKNNIKTLEESDKCKELWDIDNGLTLCKKCHKKTKNFGGKNG